MKVCRYGALSYDLDGAVILESMHCRGCDTLNCLIACLYAAFFATSKGVAVKKCDFCRERRKKGMRPACAAVKVVNRADVDQLNTPEAQKAYQHIMNCVRPPVTRLKEKVAEKRGVVCKRQFSQLANHALVF
jgi:Fe-S-cluster-containing dehydrogenase component